MLAAGMPSSNLDSGTLFDEGATAVHQTLRRVGFHPVRVTKAELLHYGARDFVVGWDVTQSVAGESITLRLLLDPSFPLSPVRIAIVSRDVFMHWPHVEEHGVLCLPNRSPPLSGVVQEVEAAIFYATDLIRKCLTDPLFVDSELRKEFLSYWNRSVSTLQKPVWSLLSVANANVREIFIWRGPQFRLAAESEEELKRWLNNRYAPLEYKAESGLYGHLAEPPAPPFPHNIATFTQLLEIGCPTLLPMFNERLTHDTGFLVLLGATTASGTGLIAAEFGLRGQDGYRPGGGLVWKGRGYVETKKVARLDPAWVHGRDSNEKIGTLARSKVTIVGCGSLGSHVAARLAQLGIGNFVLIDHEILEPANVGRHALGMNYVGQNKVSSLANEIECRFPHVHSVEPLVSRWSELSERELDTIGQSDLVISCVGDFAVESEINRWQIARGGEPKIIYGWLDEYGTASHALGVFSVTPCFNCVIGPNGCMREPESNWPASKTGLQTEPACGTLFQPFGPLAVSVAERLVVQAAIDALTGLLKDSVHRINAAATSELTAAGGEWSPQHLQARPADYNGAFEYEREFVPHPGCEFCAARA